ncbi:MAG: hypothetical protein CL610_22055 [Anaerolineaceae bacterium]|nr:hypothetical protein [Anaerolineaceae bacterium]
MPFKLLRLTALLTVIFAGVIGLLRVPQRDDPLMQTFLIPPEDCESPCFLGVQPGTTTIRDAVAHFEANHWLNEVTQSGQFYDLVWSGSQPLFVDTGAPTYFMSETDRVGELRVRTHLRLGDILAVLDQPDAVYSRITQSGTFVTIVYTQLGLEISGYWPCRMPRRHLWHIPVEIRMHTLAFESTVPTSMNWPKADCTHS